MIDKKIEELILVYKQLLAETVILKKEMIRVRGKLESNLYKTATKYNVITNDLLVVKNKYRGSIKCYKAPLDNDGEIKFD
tara:strand:- start:10620 stop:10859 length:240 start_codon:yes stop_codon:yes gene_type:complete